MPLDSGSRLGPYEIVGLLGTGGMGEVYRAHDSRLQREVAVKIVPPSVATSVEALARFEREARAVAGLSHPNILAIYDVGVSKGTTFAVMELLEGETLRARLASGSLPQRKAVEIASEIARGLAAAHDKQIVHRDLKPENVFITNDGSVKILDFGLARSVAVKSSSLSQTDSPTLAPQTEPGTVLGTVGYMAPEQVRGEASDHRVDIFALGCVLYEMLSGRRPFQRDTSVETMSAILKDDVPEGELTTMGVSPAVVRTMRRCLEKRPDERFQSARDLAFALESSLDSTSASASTALPAARSRRRLATGGAVFVLGLAVGAALGAFFLRRGESGESAARVPAFHRLTFENGTIRDARFTADRQSVIYSAAWDGNPLRIFLTRLDAPDSVRLNLPDARLLSISRTGDMAVSLGHTFEGWMGLGTLARSSVLGSAPRPMLEHVREAEWAPDGEGLAIVRREGALERLEFPAGRVLYQSSGWISDVRFSAAGDRLAFADHPVFADDAGGVSVVDLQGKRTSLSDGWITVRGLAWSPDGSEVWFTATRTGSESALYGVTTSGRQRVVMAAPTRMKLLDVAPDGRALIARENSERRVEALLQGSMAPVNLSLRANSTSQWISADGAQITISDQSSPQYATYLMRAGGGTPVLLGEGQAYGVSPDGRWALALPATGSPVLIHPTGAGETRRLPNPQDLLFDNVAWLPDSRRVVLFGQRAGELSRGYVQDIDSGAPQPFTAEGVSVGALRWWALPVSPDGRRVVARNATGTATIYSLKDGASEPIRGLRADEVAVQWSEQGHALLMARGLGLPWTVEQLDLATGRRTPALEIRAGNAAGLGLSILAVSPDARYYVHSYSRRLNDLFVVDGLR